MRSLVELDGWYKKENGGCRVWNRGKGEVFDL